MGTTLPHVGKLVRNPVLRFPHLCGRDIPLPLLGGSDGEDFSKAAFDAVDRFFRLGPRDHARATAKVVAYCNYFSDALKKPRLVLASPEDVWKHVTSAGVIIENAEDDPVDVKLSCSIAAVDEEHGVELTYHGGHKLGRVGGAE